jgi:tyrosine-protein kinase
VDLRDYARTLRKHWLLITALAAVGAAAGLVVSLLTTPMYEARTQLFVSASSSDSSGVTDVYQGSLFSQQRVKSYAQIVNSPRILQPVINELGLQVSADDLAERVTATAPLDTVLIDVTVADRSPDRARDLANAIGAQVDKYIKSLDTSAGAPVHVSVVRPAEVPASPVSPKTKLNIALGLLLGLAAGVALAVLRETLDTTVKKVEDLQALTSVATLGVVSYDSDASRRPLVSHLDPHSSRAESFRTLRTNLQFVDIDRPPRTVVVTSAVAGEGKSTTACNLAITLAQAGIRVALVEGDLRRPKIADYLGLEGNVGLTSVLIGRIGLADALQPWGRSGLSVLASGPIPPNPSELLGSGHMVGLLRELQQGYDVVILDAPPLLPVTDAAVLSRICDGAVLVVRHGATKREQVEQTVEALRAVDARILGTVLNMTPTKGPDSGAYAYGYGYSSRADRPHLGTVTAQGDVLPETRLARRARASR